MSELLRKTHVNPYGYIPTLWVTALFVALFSLSTLLHLGQALWSRRWFLLPSIVLGGCGEIIGWAARLWSSKNVYNGTPFLMQISTTIISPTFLAAANFIILGGIINRVGPQYSLLSPRNYGLIFVTVDVVALVVQAIGGGIASAATQQVDGDPDGGARIMLGGIIVQLVAIVIYFALAVDFVIRAFRGRTIRASAADSDSDPEKAKPRGLTPKLKAMLVALGFSTLVLFIRAVYRTIELSDGWGGRVIHTQVYFNVLDGAMIVLSMYTLNFFHPGFLVYND